MKFSLLHTLNSIRRYVPWMFIVSLLFTPPIILGGNMYFLLPKVNVYCFFEVDFCPFCYLAVFYCSCRIFLERNS
jgi:hypothetical protein